MAAMVQPSIMAIFAHPDDEAFSVGGTLAHYASKGVKVTLVCATRGEAGKITDPSLSITDLGQQREGELRRATEALGIAAPIFLDLHDSGRYERTRFDDPKALMNLTPLDIERPLRELIAQHQPQVLITFDPHGAYGHVDHLQIQRAATAAFFSTGHLPYGGPQRLFFTCMGLERAELLTGRFGEELAPDLYGVSDSTIALKMDVSAYTERKEAALSAHGSQMGETSAMGRMSPRERAQFEAWLGREYYAVGGVRASLQLPLRGLFDGLEGLSHLDA